MIHSMQELEEVFEDNIQYGLILLVEDYKMQAVNIYMNDENEELWGMYPYPSETGEAMIIKPENLTYPLEILYQSKFQEND